MYICHLFNLAPLTAILSIADIIKVGTKTLTKCPMLKGRCINVENGSRIKCWLQYQTACSMACSLHFDDDPGKREILWQDLKENEAYHLSSECADTHDLSISRIMQIFVQWLRQHVQTLWQHQNKSEDNNLITSY